MCELPTDQAARPALVLLSGGLDSTVCLGWARREFGQVEAITFLHYRAEPLELACAKRSCSMWRIPQTVVPIDTFGALSASREISGSGIEYFRRFPSSYVPGRNLVFVLFAAIHALTSGCRDLVGGTTLIDQSSYPDSRPQTLTRLQQLLRLGLDEPFMLHSPLLNRSKAQTILLARELGVLDALAWTQTCQRGVFPPCQSCPPCVLRYQGFKDANIPDPLIARARADASAAAASR